MNEMCGEQRKAGVHFRRVNKVSLTLSVPPFPVAKQLRKKQACRCVTERIPSTHRNEELEQVWLHSIQVFSSVQWNVHTVTDLLALYTWDRLVFVPIRVNEWRNISPKMRIYSPSGHPRCRWVCFFIRTDLEKCSTTSLAHQWILCSEWVPSEWESTQLFEIVNLYVFFFFNLKWDFYL